MMSIIIINEKSNFAQHVYVTTLSRRKTTAKLKNECQLQLAQICSENELKN
jgi:hypothetical protein